MRSTSPILLFSATRGQAGLIAVAITVLIALILGAVTITGLTNMQSKRTITARGTLQSYYVAQAGVQEALATRMLPRSNYLSFNPPAGIPPYFPSSGLVFRQPATQTELLGVYRYLIVGGDPARKTDGSYYNAPPQNPTAPYYNVGPDTTQNAANVVPRLVTFQSSPPNSPFYIVSSGLICRSPQGVIGVDQFLNSPTTNPAAIGIVPSCKAGYNLDQTTVVVRVNMEPEVGTMDRVNESWESRIQSIATNTVTLPGPAFVPGAGWTSTFNFQDAWTHNTTINTPVNINRIVFFEFGPNRIYQSVACGAGVCNVPNPVPIKASMMVYFDGPIDYRSLSSNITGGTPPGTYYDPNINRCKVGNGVVNLNNCAIQLWQTAPGVPNQYTGMQVVPILPYLTKILLLAPLGTTGSAPNINGNGAQYELRLRLDKISSFSQAHGLPSNYLINFRTCKPGDPAPCP